MPRAFVYLYILLFALLLNFGMGFYFANRIAPSIYRELRIRGIDLCWKCNYDLRGLSQSTTACPECGAARASGKASPLSLAHA